MTERAEQTELPTVQRWVELSPQARETLSRYDQARSLREGYAAAEDDLKAELIALLPDWADEARVDGQPVFTWRVVHQTKLDGTKLKETLPDVWQAFSKPVTYKRFFRHT